MNPESDECGATSITKDPKRKRVFQRRLHDQLSESRMLQVLDRTLHSTSLSNQEQEQADTKDQQGNEEEEELVCVSKMVQMGETQSTSSKKPGFQAGGVLKTVRNIHKQRAIQQENQAGH
ncbi:hypothetical protein V7S43_000972 [Phytophthora oleae]|uniref:Uncharacterized protein n=1 Tax=Phytophthora oleae TaxID=2107226 RepID=A0ABD3G3L5_9STRA